MGDYEDYYSSSSSSSSSRSSEPFPDTQCRGELYHGKVFQISTCENPNFTTTTVDGRCYNCGGMGQLELERLKLYHKSKARQAGYRCCDSQDMGARDTGHSKRYGGSQRSGCDPRPAQREDMRMSSSDEGDRGYSMQRASCCRSPNFSTTTRDGTCYNCGRFPDGRRSWYR
ncbi:hypothetical protein ONS95_008239 [Cadophora gregata]|uniref:uncharacterized protein n=1 Tax=Cadophora gregata TaxID=51156 RepID=UPI0026DD6AA6|nr:uncharacterized protein ONS95_008239 [Cadophora gregata]KAK0100280.1 hypothetical protein ONS96_007562 [Cadophora gregata f. sp. sojae]KAK0126656.1 hypothetical protein ONS95_008239 [Cadophora gregata]